MVNVAADGGAEDAFSRAARSLQDEGGSQRTLQRAVTLATELVDGCDLASVSIVHRGRPIDTPARSAELMTRVDQLQYDLGEGPCLDAIWAAETVTCPDLAAEQRWPRWAPEVAGWGIGSLLCVRLFTTRDTLGALNLMSWGPGAFDSDAVLTASHLAAHLAVALAESQHAEDLQSGALDRTMIGHAEGILMERFSLDPDRAFEVLSRVAQERSTPLLQVAAELVRTRRTPGGNATAEDLSPHAQPGLR